MTFAIFIGILFSYDAKIVVKFLTSSPTAMNQEAVDGYILLQIVNFIAFGLVEFIPIALWTALKAPEDFFDSYNDLRKNILDKTTYSY